MRAAPPSLGEPTKDLEAYRLYQEGKYFFNQHQPPDSYNKAIERYQQAVQRDPKFALAFAGIADAYAYLAEYFAVAPREVMPKAKWAAEKALAIDYTSGEAQASLALVQSLYDFNRAEAEKGFKAFVVSMKRSPLGATAMLMGLEEYLAK